MPSATLTGLPRTFLCAMGVAALGACWGDVVEPERDLLVELESPNGVEGAAVIELVGPGLGTVTAAAGQAFTHVSGDTTRVVVLLDAPGRVEFTVHLSGLTYPGAAVLQVADSADQLRALAGYRAKITGGTSRR
jgi:hypothetical protein